MTAKEMFEELGYKQIKSNELAMVYENEECYIVFDLFYETVDKRMKLARTRSIYLKEFKAIQKQIEELGW